MQIKYGRNLPDIQSRLPLSTSFLAPCLLQSHVRCPLTLCHGILTFYPSSFTLLPSVFSISLYLTNFPFIPLHFLLLPRSISFLSWLLIPFLLFVLSSSSFFFAHLSPFIAVLPEVAMSILIFENMPSQKARERSGLLHFSFSSTLVSEGLKLLRTWVPLAGAQTGSCHDCWDPAGKDFSDVSDSSSYCASTSE